jgi:hypothetical protein
VGFTKIETVGDTVAATGHLPATTVERAMLTVEHFTAEALRQERLRAYAVHYSHQDGLRWLFEMFGLRAPKRS